MKIRSIVTLMFALITVAAYSAVTEVKGVFKGENLIIRSAIDTSTNSNCVTDIYLNGEKLELDLHHVTIEIPLREKLDKGDHVSIRIYHGPNCKPEIVNPGVIQRKTLFAFLAFSVSQEGFRWTTRGEIVDSYYSVQRLEEGKWVTVLKQKSNARMSGNIYDKSFDHFSGFSVYRVKYVQPDGFKDVSQKMKIRSNKIPVSFFPTKVKDYLTFVNNKKKPVAYKIYDSYGDVVLQGVGISVDCRALEPKKMYTLAFDNQRKPFQKSK